jgi:flagellar hook-associated protein 3 FlgL
MLAVSGATDIGTLAQTTANTELIQQRIDQLSEETSTGLLSQTYDGLDSGGLGSGAAQALDLTAQLAQNATDQTNVSEATTIANETQSALGQIETLASSFAQSITSQLTSGVSSTDALATTARSTLSEIADLLNTKVGDTYIFAGQDSSNPPIPSGNDITSSSFFTAISNAVANLSTTGAAGVEAATLSASESGSATSPFSATLEASNAPATVDLGGGEFVQTGVLADQNTDAVSTGVGTTSTGSYIRDLLRGLATVGSLSSSQANDPNFETLLQDTLTSVQNANTALNTDIAGLGSRQDRLTTAATDLTDTATVLNTQLSNVQDANLAEVATELSTAQTQLQSSYQVIASLGQLSLAKFLPAS